MPSSLGAAIMRPFRAMALPLFIGWRYTRAKRRRGFVSLFSLISILGIAIGVWALIVVMSVMNGFQEELRSRILGMVSHATVQAVDGSMSDWESVGDELRQRPRVKGAAPFIIGQVMLTRGSSVNGAQIRGIQPEREREVSRALDNIIAGSASNLEAGQYQIILGSGLASRLGVGVGSRVTVVTPEARMSVAGVTPRLRRFTVGAIFDVDMARYDSSLAFIHIADAQTLFRMGDGVTGIRLAFDDMFAAPELAKEAARSLDGIYRVSDWTQEHRNFFRAVQTEKTVMFFILCLILVVAVFNIIATLVMVVTDKQADIAILRTIGSRPGMIVGIFLVQGGIIGISGTTLGVVSGVATALNVETIVPAIESLLDFQFLPKDIYLISELPSKLRITDVVWAAGVALFGSLFFTLFPASMAGRTAPAEVLRHD